MNAPALPTLAVVCSWFVLGLRPCSAQQKQLWIGGSDAGYIEAASCQECHLEIAASYARTGMARSFGRMHEGTPFPEGSYRHAASEQDFSAYRRDGKPYIKRTLPGPDGTPSYPLEREVHYWFGSGNHARSYIHR